MPFPAICLLLPETRHPDSTSNEELPVRKTMTRIEPHSTTSTLGKFVKPSLVELIALLVVAFSFSLFLSEMPPRGLIDWIYINSYFDADIPRVYENLTIRTSGHHQTFKHPLFSIVFWPLTQSINTLVQNEYLSIRITLALNSCLSIAALWSLLRKFRLQAIDRVLLVLLYLASGGFIFWYSVIETFPFGATTVLIALHAIYWFKCTSPRMRTVLMLFSGVASISVTITNFAATVFAVLTAHGAFDNIFLRSFTETIKKQIRPLFAYFATVFLLAAGLSIVQDRLFGEATLFFNLRLFRKETVHVGGNDAVKLWARPGQLLLSPIVVPKLDYVSIPSIFRTRSGLTFADTLVLTARLNGVQFHTILSSVASVTWSILLITGLFCVFRPPAKLEHAHHESLDSSAINCFRTRKASFLTLLTFFVMHLIYGQMPFLYIAHLLPLLVIIASGSFVSEFGSSFLAKNAFRGVVLTTILSAGISNFLAFREVVMTLAKGLVAA